MLTAVLIADRTK